MKQIERFTHIEGVAVYNVTNGVQDETPSAVDVSLSIPEITFEATEVPMMGSVSVVDQTRVQGRYRQESVTQELKRSLQNMQTAV